MSIHAPRPSRAHNHFTAFHSAAEEATVKAEHESWDNEGGYLISACGRVVRTPGARFPYKVVLTNPGHADTARAFDSIREAEAFIRRNTPMPVACSTLYDRDAD